MVDVASAEWAKRLKQWNGKSEKYFKNAGKDEMIPSTILELKKNINNLFKKLVKRQIT